MLASTTALSLLLSLGASQGLGYQIPSAAAGVEITHAREHVAFSIAAMSDYAAKIAWGKVLNNSAAVDAYYTRTHAGEGLLFGIGVVGHQMSFIDYGDSQRFFLQPRVNVGIVTDEFAAYARYTFAGGDRWYHTTSIGGDMTVPISRWLVGRGSVEAVRYDWQGNRNTGAQVELSVGISLMH